MRNMYNPTFIIKTKNYSRLLKKYKINDKTSLSEDCCTICFATYNSLSEVLLCYKIYI